MVKCGIEFSVASLQLIVENFHYSYLIVTSPKKKRQTDYKFVFFIGPIAKNYFSTSPVCKNLR